MQTELIKLQGTTATKDTAFMDSISDFVGNNWSETPLLFRDAKFGTANNFIADPASGSILAIYSAQHIGVCTSQGIRIVRTVEGVAIITSDLAKCKFSHGWLFGVVVKGDKTHLLAVNLSQGKKGLRPF